MPSSSGPGTTTGPVTQEWDTQTGRRAFLDTRIKSGFLTQVFSAKDLVSLLSK
jgi:hypothetical protein